MNNDDMEVMGIGAMIREMKAEAYREGAEHAWSVTGEGWNGEYANGNAPGGFFVVNPDEVNPYESLHVPN